MRDPVVVVGSSPGCTIAIGDDPRVAHEHVRITPRGDGVLVQPLAAGVRVGGAPLPGPAAVKLGVPIQVGETVLVMRPPPPEPRWPAGPEGDVDTVYDPLPAGWRDDPPPRAPWRVRLSADPVEHDLLAALRDRPDDATTRMVYADWLEQHGQPAKSHAVRGEAEPERDRLLHESDADWRAITSRGPILRCAEPACPGRWDLLAASDDERRRYCGSCLGAVWFCAGAAEVRGHVRGGHPIVLDAALPPAVLDADRVDAILRKVVDSEWKVSRSTDSWRVNPEWCEYYTVVLDRLDLRLQYGGTELGLTSFQVDEPPIWTEAVLPLAGLDEAAVTAWLSRAFRALPPTQDRNF